VTPEEIQHLFTYHRPSDDAVKRIQHTREVLGGLALELTDGLGPSSHLTVAIRKLHEASMACNYAIIAADTKEGGDAAR